MRPYSPGGILIALATTRKESIPPTSSIHRLGRGLPGYLILFAPHAFEPQCQLQSSKPPSPLVFLLISMHFTATLGIPLTSPALQLSSIKCNSAVELRAFTFNLPNNLRTLYAQSFRTTLAPYVLPRLLAHSLPGLSRQVPSLSSSLTTEVYNPKTFFLHAALLGQSFLHCPIFLTAASRRSLDRVSVPVWPITLSGRLTIVALVGRYPTNKLMIRKLLFCRIAPFTPSRCRVVVLCGISSYF